MNDIRHIGIAFIFACFAHFGVAQTCEQHKKIYPFLRCEANTIQHKGYSQKLFESFYKELSDLQTTGIGRLHILHFGDSHIQADHLPNRMRQLLLSEHTSWSTGDRGMIFPFTMAKTNNPHSYIVDYMGEWSSVRSSILNTISDLGVTGMSISTSDPRAVLYISQAEKGYVTSPFTRIRVYHSTGKNIPKIRLGQEQNLLYQFTSDFYG
jgi:hypothetical protein